MSEPPREGFASRWSRLKRQPPAPAEPAPIAAAPPAPEIPVEIPPDATTIPVEDITAWLGRNIPEGWREVALRRMWSADTAIRDFIGPADYAWDWNTPGGAPGWGPLRATDDLIKLLARAIGEDLPKPDPEPAETPEIASAAMPIDAQMPPPEDPPEPSREPPAETVPARPAPRRGGRATPV
jgi:hypothetical protein